MKVVRLMKRNRINGHIIVMHSVTALNNVAVKMLSAETYFVTLRN